MVSETSWRSVPLEPKTTVFFVFAQSTMETDDHRGLCSLSSPVDAAPLVDVVVVLNNMDSNLPI